MSQAAPSFLNPLSLDAFYSDYWEKQPLHIAKTQSAISDAVGLPAIEELLTTQPVYFPGVQLTQSGKRLDVDSYADRDSKILPLRLFEGYSQGATIVISQAQSLFAPLNNLCREVIRTMKLGCQANLYISPPGQQGFNAHYDTHDVFIMQIDGAKTFNFYPSNVELPCPDETFDPDTLDAAHIDESISLSAGDTLYIPRGIVHDAVADARAPSIHVTLGVYPVLMRDVLLEAVQLATRRHRELRQSIDPFSGTEVRQQDWQVQFDELFEQARQMLKQPDTLEHILSSLQDSMALDANQDCSGLTSRLVSGNSNLRQLPPFSSMRLRRDMVIHHHPHSLPVRVHTFGQVLEFDTPVAAPVCKLLAEGELSDCELQCLGIEQRERFVRRLLQENLVELV